MTNMTKKIDLRHAKRSLLDDYLKVRFTTEEKDAIKAAAAAHKMDMACLVRFIVQEWFNGVAQYEERMVAVERQLTIITKHACRTRSLLNADLLERYGDKVDAVAESADRIEEVFAKETANG